jgi:uncharacterized HAD superfamily protein
MRIGLDIDNVITDFDKLELQEFLKEDKNKRNKGIINPKAEHITNGMFDWTKEEVVEFTSKNMERMASQFEPRENCKEIMDKLMKEGNELILISHRAKPDYEHPWETTINWLKKNNIHYTKLVISQSPDKSKECKDLKIDVMVDDRIPLCETMELNGIKCIGMRTRYNNFFKTSLEIAENWIDLYNKIEILRKEKIEDKIL